MRGVPLGEALIRLGFIKPEDVEQALARQATDRRKLGEILVAAGKVTKDQIERAMALQMGMGVFNAQDGVDPSVATLVDEKTARRYQAIPVRFDADGMLVVAMVDPTNLHAVDDLQIVTGHTIRPARASAEEVQQLLASTSRIDDIVGIVDDEDFGGGADDLRDEVDNAPVVKLVNWVIAQAVDDGASDIHFEPQAKELRALPHRRRAARDHDGPAPLAGGVISRLKIMADLDIAERRVPQDGRISLIVGGKPIDMRVATLPTVYGEKIVMRLLDKSNVMLELSTVGFAGGAQAPTRRRSQAVRRHPRHRADRLRQVDDAVRARSTSSTSRRRTSSRSRTRSSTGCTGINQVQVNVKAGLTFAAGLRSILRCDPDIVMIGEIRDRETAQIAVESALTGHLVLSTLHTNDAPGATAAPDRDGHRAVPVGSRDHRRAGPAARAPALPGMPRARRRSRTRMLMEIGENDDLPRGLPDPAPIYGPRAARACSIPATRGAWASTRSCRERGHPAAGVERGVRSRDLRAWHARRA